MNVEYPPIGTKWLDRDLRSKRTVEVIRHDLAARRVRIHCIETETLSWAKPERFNGKSGGYALLDASGSSALAARREQPRRSASRR